MNVQMHECTDATPGSNFPSLKDGAVLKYVVEAALDLIEYALKNIGAEISGSS